MKNKTQILIVLSIATIIGGMVLNFPEFLMGRSATVKNLIVTFAYIAIWILILRIGTKHKNREIIGYCSVFWSITLFTAIVGAYINATGSSADWSIPFAILFLGQWHGIEFFVRSSLVMSIIVALISLVMFTIAIKSFKHIKRE